MAGNTKAPEEYSTNPNTVRARRRKSKLEGEDKVRDNAQTADYKALIVARKAVQNKDEFKEAPKPVKENMLEQAMLEVMEHRRAKRIDTRSKVEDYRTESNLAQLRAQTEGPSTGGLTITKFLEANGFMPPPPLPKGRATPAAAAGEGEASDPIPVNHPQTSNVNPAASAPAQLPGTHDTYQQAGTAGINPMNEAGDDGLGPFMSGTGFPPPNFLKPDPPFFAPMPLMSAATFLHNSNQPMTPGPAHQAQPYSQYHRASTVANRFPTPSPRTSLFHNPPVTSSPFTNTSLNTAASSIPRPSVEARNDISPTNEVDALRGVLENIVPTVSNLTRDIGSLRTDTELIRQELIGQKTRLTETDAKVVQAEGSLRTLTSESIPGLREAMGKIETAIASLEAKVGQGSDAEVAKMRDIMKAIQDALGQFDGY